ncbi:MAG: hypothetical protein SWX82_13655 [Cyanobacteriota bacterium]|nr:hypothetical protein [Cyanobacteriota bacterium]
MNVLIMNMLLCIKREESEKCENIELEPIYPYRNFLRSINPLVVTSVVVHPNGRGVGQDQFIVIREKLMDTHPRASTVEGNLGRWGDGGMGGWRNLYIYTIFFCISYEYSLVTKN